MAEEEVLRWLKSEGVRPLEQELSSQWTTWSDLKAHGTVMKLMHVPCTVIDIHIHGCTFPSVSFSSLLLVFLSDV